MAENQQPEVPDANLRAAIEGLDDLSNILRQALADDDALAAGGAARASHDDTLAAGGASEATADTFPAGGTSEATADDDPAGAVEPGGDEGQVQ